MKPPTLPVQDSSPLDDQALESVREILRQRADSPGALLPVLHAVQELLGHIPPSLVPEIAVALNLSRAEVHGVISYYSHFRSEPGGRVILQVCVAEACLARGAQSIAAQAEQLTGCGMHQTRPDRSLTIEPIYCLGLCATGPAIVLSGRPYARVCGERLQVLLAGVLDLPAQAPVHHPADGV